MSFDTLVDPWLDNFSSLLSRDIPNAYRIYLRGRKYLQEGNAEKAMMCRNLIKVLHNSTVPLETKIGEGTRFGYDGVGVILHPESEIGRFVTIGAGVTLGARRDAGRLTDSGKRASTPLIADYAYLSAGAKIIGGVRVGCFSIVAPNAVVIKDVPDFSIAGGIPGKIIGKVTPDNVSNYRATYLPLRSLSDDDFNALFNRCYEESCRKD